MKRCIIVLLFLLGIVELGTAQNITISGQIRERSEVDDRSLSPGTSVDILHLLRSRVGATARIDEQLLAFIELQDARSFGSGPTSNSGSPALDLRQGYVDIRQIGGLPLALRVGRQSIGYANERLIGRGDWTNTAQSFDAVVARIGDSSMAIDLIGAGIQRRSTLPTYRRDHILAGGWGTIAGLLPGGSIQGFYLFDNPYRDSVQQNRQTTGLYLKGESVGVDYEVEGSYQFGRYKWEGESRFEKDISAWMGGARLGYTIPELNALRIGFGYDRLSGNRPGESGTYGAFSNLYGTHHRFYGSMDYLVNVAASTRGLGLEQFIGQLSFVPASGVKAGAELHLLALAEDPSAVIPTLPATTSRGIGRELDLSLGYQASRTFNVTAGFSLFDGDRDRYVLPGQKTTRWGFVMVTAGF
jgi:hypothetical protein